MPLSYEQRVELLAKARAAKKEKQNASKPAPTPATPAVIDSDTSSEEIEEPTKFPKSKIPNPKWLKNPETQKKVKVEGKTLLDPSASTENSPKAILRAKPGTLKNAGLLTTLDNALVNSEFVTGFGLVRFTPPVSLTSSIK